MAGGGCGGRSGPHGAVLKGSRGPACARGSHLRLTGEGPACRVFTLAVKAGRVPRLPAADKVLPWAAAVEAVKQRSSTLPPLPRPLYAHWLKRWKAEGGPLLPHLWYQQPWKVGGAGGALLEPTVAVGPDAACTERGVQGSRVTPS